ncbi:hypothetical protein D3C78_1790210 [compost metagenome]
MQKHIDTAKVVGGNINLLTIKPGGNGTLTEKFHSLEKQRTRATSRIIYLVDGFLANRSKACEQF